MKGALFAALAVLPVLIPLGFPPLPPRLETVYSDSIRKAELEARLSYLKVSPVLLPVGWTVPPPSSLDAPPPSHLSLQQPHLLHKQFLQKAAAHIPEPGLLKHWWPEQVCITLRLQQLSRFSAFSVRAAQTYARRETKSSV